MRKFALNFLLALALWLVSLVPADAAARFLICPTGCTVTAADTSIWSTSSAGATGASVPGASDTVTMDASSCSSGTVTFGAGYNPTWQTWTWGASACTIDLDTNDNNVTLNTGATSFSATGTGVRTLNCGSGTLTLSAANAGVNFTTGTNATINCSNWNIHYSAASGNGDRTFINTGGTNWGNLTVASRSGNYDRLITFTGGISWNSCTYGAGLNIMWANSQTCTTLSIQGTSTHPNLWVTTVGGATANVTATTIDLDWIAMRDMIFVATAGVCDSCFDLGGNSAVTINVPSGAGGGGGIFGGG